MTFLIRLFKVGRHTLIVDGPFLWQPRENALFEASVSSYYIGEFVYPVGKIIYPTSAPAVATSTFHH